jgi:hypothetical protein
MALGLMWFWRRNSATLGMTALAVGWLTLLLIPWAIFGGGLVATISRDIEAAVTYRTAYSGGLNIPERLTYYLFQLPNQLGQVEVAMVIIGAMFVAVMMLRRRLERAEVMYAAVIVFFYLVFALPANNVPNIGVWMSLSVWIFFLAGGSRLLAPRWPITVRRASPALLAGVGIYVLLAYSLGLVALANWPDNEQSANAQLRTVTTELAQELGGHLSVGQCFTYAPGPGWPASLEFLLTDSNGAGPQTTPIDVDPAVTTSQYVRASTACAAAVVYREDIKQVAKVFFCPPVRQPYLQALADWVRGPLSGYTLARTWRLADLPPAGPHTLGRYEGVSLTVDLYLRAAGA